MKKWISLFLAALLLTGCAADAPPSQDGSSGALIAPARNDLPFSSAFDSETLITLSDSGISCGSSSVFTTHDIVYYRDRTAYESGNPYGEGEAWERHSADEAAAHTVVNITAPGRYRLTGTLSAGQIKVDLGEDASSDPGARVELILQDASITCTVAPAIVFYNVYECDGDWSADTAKPDVDTSAAGAVLVLEGENTVSGSHVARIYKDKEGEKKLWKQDGAIYSYMSMNVFGPGSLSLTADNEGLDTELHLTVNGGDISIRAGNDGINTNEDGVSVTTINGGRLRILAGMGEEGDGIDSNGYLVINGGIVISSAKPESDAGLDSDLGSYIHGGTVIALGSTMDWAESDSNQVTMNLQFASRQSGGELLTVTRADGTVLFAYDPSLGDIRQYQGAVISSPNFRVGESYQLYLGGSLSGTQDRGLYDVTTLEGFADTGSRLCYTGSDLRTGPGGMGQRPGGEPPAGWGGGEPPEKPRGDRPDGQEPPEGWKEGEIPSMPEGGEPPQDWQDGQPPAGPGNRPGTDGSQGEASSLFLMQDKVNAFTGIRPE